MTRMGIVRKSRNLIVIIIMMVLSAPVMASAGPLVVDASLQSIMIGQDAEYLEDTSGIMTIGDVSSDQASSLFRKLPSSDHNFGYTSSVYWYRFSVENRMDRETEWFFRCAFPLLNSITFYASSGNTYSEMSAGSYIPYHERAFDNETFVFPVTQKPGTMTFYVKAVSRDSAIFLPMSIWNRDALYRQIAREQGVNGMYYGILLIMFLFNLFIFFSVKERIYFYYILYIVGIASQSLAMDGLGFRFIWPGNVDLNRYYIHIFIVCILVSIFSSRFLGLESRAPVLYRLFRANIVMVSLGFPAWLIIPDRMPYLAVGFTLITAVISLSSGIIMLFRGDRAARYYVISWTFVLTGGIIRGLMGMKLVPFILMNEAILKGSFVLQLLTYSLALADRINILRRELAVKVGELTEAEKSIREKNERLNAANEELAGANEELQATVEELEATGEEFEAQNQELINSKNELVLSESRYRMLVENTMDVPYVIDREGIITYIGPQIEKYGFSRDELRGKNFLDFIDPRDHETMIQVFAQSIAQAVSIGTTFRLLDRGQGTIWFHEEGINVFDEKGEVTGFSGILRDITEEHQAREDLARSRELFELFMRHSPIYTYIKEITPDGIRVLQASDSFRDLIGLSGRDIRGKTMHELFPPDFADKIIADDMAVVAGKTVLKIDEEFNGRYHTTIKFPIVQGDRTLLAGYTIDITERRESEIEREKLQARLNQAQKMEVVGKLAGGIAHDFNNMLGGIMGSAELLGRKMEAESSLRKYVEMIKQAAERASDLTRKLLVFSRQEQSVKKKIDVHESIRSAIALLERSIDRRIEISTSLSAPDSTVQGDGAMLQNAFLNLAVNARDAMPLGGELVFSTRCEDIDEEFCRSMPFSCEPGRYIVTEVRDSGGGIPGDIMERIFEPFFTTKQPGKGTGLGLSMVYATVQEHGGTIGVSSEPGSGTAFRIYLPLDGDSGPGSMSDPMIPVQGSGLILIIDDEEIFRITLSEMLSSLGYEVITAADGAEGVEMFRRERGRISLIILDMIMPKMNGRETLTRLREIDAGVRVLVSSGFMEETERDALNEARPDGFIGKPYNIAALSKIMAEIINNGKQ